MFRKTQNFQISFADRLLNAGEQTKKAVDGSRAKLVGDIVYPNVDESKFEGLFSEKGSRPNISIRQYFSALVLKRMYGMSDETLIEFLRCGSLNFQYALHTTQDENQPLSESSLRRFRRRIEAYDAENKCDLIKEEFDRISRQMAVDMGVLGKDPSQGDDEIKSIIVRMDSMEIESHAKAMSRVEIIYMTILIVLRFLLKKEFINLIPNDLLHYLEKGDHNTVMYRKPSQDKAEGKPDKRIEKVVSELLLLESVLKANFTEAFLSEIPEYKVFQRVKQDQTRVDEQGNIVPKDSKEISPDSVQNPFDVTATYRYKNKQHHGYVMNVGEAVDGEGNGIIICADVEQNTRSDSSMAADYVKSQPDNGPEVTVSCDGAYDSEELRKAAEQKNVRFQTTALSGTQPYDIDADFVMNEDGTEILSCPCGHKPVKCSYSASNGYVTAMMPDNCCATCPHRDECNVTINKKASKVRLTAKMASRAQTARNFDTEEGRKNACIRNGVEGIMSVMRRKYGIDHLPIFGIKRVRYWVWTSLLSYNLVKFQKYQRSLEKQAAVI